MDVDRELWWSVWWPGVVAWIVMVLAVVVAVAVFVVAWRVRKRFAGPIEVPENPIYLNERRVAGIYQFGYGDAITKQVVDKVGVTKEGKLALKGLNIDADAALTRGREVIKTYMEEYDAIQAIRVVLQGLEAAHGVVHVDLHNLTVARNTALERHFGSGGEVLADQLPRDCYVSVRGDFRVVDGPNGGAVFLAPIGNPADSTTGPWARIACDSDGLRDDTLPAADDEGETLHARCLGKIQEWRERDNRQELVIRPVAMFQ